MQKALATYWQGFGMSLQIIDLLWSLHNETSLLMLIWICNHSPVLASPLQQHFGSSGIRFSQGVHSLDPSDAQFTVGLALLWKSNATAYLTGGRAQVVMWMMGSRWNRSNFPYSPTSHLLLCNLTPNMPQTGTMGNPIPQNSGMNTVQNNQINFLFITTREKPEVSNNKVMMIEMLIALIWSVIRVYMYWNIALYPINICSYYVLIKIFKKKCLRCLRKQILTTLIWSFHIEYMYLITTL